MKKFLSLISVGLMVLFLASCGSDSKKDTPSGFTEQKIEIPAELENNPKAKEYFVELSKAVDEFAFALDGIAKEVQDMGLKEGEEPSTFQKLKLIKIIAEHAAPITEKSAKYAEVFGRSEAIKAELSDTELQAYAQVMDRFNLRMEELNKKYAKLGGSASGSSSEEQPAENTEQPTE